MHEPADPGFLFTAILRVTDDGTIHTGLGQYVLDRSDNCYDVWMRIASDSVETGEPVYAEYDGSRRVHCLLGSHREWVQHVKSPSGPRAAVIFTVAAALYFLNLANPRYTELRACLESVVGTRAQVHVVIDPLTMDILHAERRTAKRKKAAPLRERPLVRRRDQI